MMCKNCHKPEEEHFTCSFISKPFWCIKNGRKLYSNSMLQSPMPDYLQDIAFMEMDNLTYIEHVAKQKNLI